QVRLEFETRVLKHAQLVSDELTDAKSVIVEQLTHELFNAGDPVDWWETRLPSRLNQALKPVKRTLANELQKRVSADAAWLVQQVHQAVGWRMTLSRPDDMQRDLAAGTT